MKPIMAFEEYSRLLKAFKAKHPRFGTNCFLMPDQLRRAISEGRLYQAEQQQVLMLFLHQEDSYAFFYFLGRDAQAQPVLPAHDLPLIMNLPVRQSGDQIAPPKEAALFVRAGFTLAASHVRMKKLLAPDSVSPPIAANDKVHSTGTLTRAMIDLWRASIDPLSTPLPMAPGLLPEYQRVYFILDAQQRVAAALQSNVSGRSVTIEHVSTRQHDRGRGLGHCLMTALEHDARQAGMRELQLWVDERNLPAMKLYTSCGFSGDGMASLQYRTR